jgi:hypothetical protein
LAAPLNTSSGYSLLGAGFVLFVLLEVEVVFEGIVMPLPLPHAPLGY